MESSHYGELGLGSSGKSTSRKGKKNSSSSEKPKQPQRGLGVAQLEKIRLNTQFAHHEQPPPPYIPTFNNHHHHHHPPPPPFLIKEEEEDVRVQMGFSSSPPSVSSSSYIATSSSFYPHHPNTSKSVFGEVDHRINPDIRYGEFQSSTTVARPYSNHQHSNSFLPQHWVQQLTTLPLLEQNMEDAAQKKRYHDRSSSMGSMGQNSDSSDMQEIDLELKLSL